MLAASAVLIMFMVGPWLAGLLGVKAGDDTVAVPDINLSTLKERGTYAELDHWIDEQLPGRTWAQDTIAEVDYRFYKDSLNVQDVIGNDGWVFERIELDLFCPGPTELGLTAPSIDLSPKEARDQIARLSSIVRASGREFAYVIAPSRAYAYPDRLGERAGRLTRCAKEYRDGLRSALEAEPVNGVVPLWDPVKDAATQPNSTVYYPHDLHWTTSGAAIMTQGLVDHFQPGLWDPSALEVIGTDRLEGAALKQIGIPGVDEVPRVGVLRDGVQPQLVDEYRDPNRRANEEPLPPEQHLVTTGEGGVLLPPPQPYLLQQHPVIEFQTQTGGAPLIKGNTAVVHDSFVWWTPSVMPPYFENLDLLYNTPVAQGTVLADRWTDINRLIVESSETLLLPGLAPDEPLFSRLVGPAFAELDQSKVALPDPPDGWRTAAPGIATTRDDATSAGIGPAITVQVPDNSADVGRVILAVTVTSDAWDDDVPALEMTDPEASMQTPFATVPAIRPGDGITTRTLLFDLAGSDGIVELEPHLGEAQQVRIDQMGLVELVS